MKKTLEETQISTSTEFQTIEDLRFDGLDSGFYRVSGVFGMNAFDGAGGKFNFAGDDLPSETEKAFGIINLVDTDGTKDFPASSMHETRTVWDDAHITFNFVMRWEGGSFVPQFGQNGESQVAVYFRAGSFVEIETLVDLS